MNGKNKTFYKPRTSAKNVAIFFAAFLMFPVMGVIAVINGAVPVGIAVTAFGSLILIYLLIRISPGGKEYSISSDGIFLKNSGRKFTAHFDDIEFISHLDNESFNRLMEIYTGTILQAEVNFRAKSWLGSSIKYGKIQRFISVPVSNSVKTRGSFRNIVSYKANTAGDAVFIRTREGEDIIITPEKAADFISDLRFKGVRAAEASTVLLNMEKRIKEAAGKTDTIPRGLQIYRKVSLILMVILFAGFVLYTVFLKTPETAVSSDTENTNPAGNIGKDQRSAGPEEVEHSFIYSDSGLAEAYWENGDCFYFAVNGGGYSLNRKRKGP